jgi:hypothetical protein
MKVPGQPSIRLSAIEGFIQNHQIKSERSLLVRIASQNQGTMDIAENPQKE